MQMAKQNQYQVLDFGVKEDGTTLSTREIQNAINICAEKGGGVIYFPQGKYLTGNLQLKNDVTLYLDKDAVILGSSDYLDYGEGGYTDALISGNNLRNISIEGEGLIDGGDCKNPIGEEGFRGPHAILLSQCRDISIRDITIVRSSNYAVFCMDCNSARIENLRVKGGHDGIHVQRCTGFDLKGCDLRTGDDAFAGCDNKNFTISNCKINSSCNGFRLGGENVTIKSCKIWGPGEYAHKISGRRNMGAAFVHFSPTDRKPTISTHNFIIEDTIVENADYLYEYDYVNGVWQTGMPAKVIMFDNVKATGIGIPVKVIGDDHRQFELSMQNVEISVHKEQKDRECINIRNFGSIKLRNVTLNNNGGTPVLICEDGEEVLIEDVKNKECSKDTPFVINSVNRVKQNCI